YGRHLGLKSSVVREVEQGDRATLESTEAGRKALLLKERLDDLKQECREGAMKARAVYQFFRARGEGNDLLLLRPDGSELTRFTFPRQEGEDGLCLADYVGQDDSVCLFVTTAGEGIRARAELAKKNGDFLKSHLLQALALETAEAYAELLHSSLRSQWGFPDPLETTMLDRFKANYHGKRYSFGYPAAPQLPRRDPAEYMVAQALDGLPGLHAEPDGTATLDAAEWTRGAATFDARLERTLEKGEGRESFLPTAASWQALRPFLWEVE